MTNLKENSENYWKLVSGVLFLAFIYFGWRCSQLELALNECECKSEIRDNVFIENFSNQVKRVDSANWYIQMGVRFEND